MFDKGSNWWFGPNSLWGKYGPDEVSFAGVSAKWGDTASTVTVGKDPGKTQANILLYGGIGLLVYIIATKM